MAIDAKCDRPRCLFQAPTFVSAGLPASRDNHDPCSDSRLYDFPCVTMTVCRLTMFSIGRKQAILFFSWLGIHPVDSADAAAV